MTDDFHDEQIRRLAAIGLTDEASIAENENAPRLPRPAHRESCYLDELHPPMLPLAKVLEYAATDGYVDAAMNRPNVASVQFIAARLHLENMIWFRDYVIAYERAYAAKKEAA